MQAKGVQASEVCSPQCTPCLHLPDVRHASVYSSREPRASLTDPWVTFWGPYGRCDFPASSASPPTRGRCAFAPLATALRRSEAFEAQDSAGQGSGPHETSWPSTRRQTFAPFIGERGVLQSSGVDTAQRDCQSSCRNRDHNPGRSSENGIAWRLHPPPTARGVHSANANVRPNFQPWKESSGPPSLSPPRRSPRQSPGALHCDSCLPQVWFRVWLAFGKGRGSYVGGVGGNTNALPLHRRWGQPLVQLLCQIPRARTEPNLLILRPREVQSPSSA